MEEFEILVTYTRKGVGPKEIKLTCAEHPNKFNVENFILVSIMKIEEPTLTSIYPLIPMVSQDHPGIMSPTNQELMKLHGITDLTYVIDEIPHTF